jgi:hypothetical protein
MAGGPITWLIIFVSYFGDQVFGKYYDYETKNLNLSNTTEGTQEATSFDSSGYLVKCFLMST